MATVRIALILVAVGGVALGAQQPVSFPKSTLPTMTIDIDGVAMRVRTSVKKETALPSPVVVFESGAGFGIDTWDPVIDKVSAFARVVAYDRSGSGQSPWDGQPLDPQRQNQRLKKLLDALGVTSPVILVGHSWGGALARYFVGEYPQMVKAVLYLDPTDITMTGPMWQQMFESFGATAQDLDAFFAIMDSSTKGLPPAVRAESLMMMDLLRTPTLDARQLKPAPKVRSSVLLASRIAPLPKGMVPFDGAAYAKALQESRVTMLRDWAQSGGRFEVVDGSGHFVYRDAPDVVINEIKVLASVP